MRVVGVSRSAFGCCAVVGAVAAGAMFGCAAGDSESSAGDVANAAAAHVGDGVLRDGASSGKNAKGGSPPAVAPLGVPAAAPLAASAPLSASVAAPPAAPLGVSAAAPLASSSSAPLAASSVAPLYGLADLHAHPMAHLGFGKRLVHGAPDVGSIVPAGTRDCNGADRRAASMNEALGHCNSTHGGWGLFDNPCGDSLRNVVVTTLESESGAHSEHGSSVLGAPSFGAWPRHDDITHQQMWIDWVRRAHEGGLRVMVALAVNSLTFAEALNGSAPRDDRGSGDLQVDELNAWVLRHNDFMEVARSSADVRRIVGAGKLAIVIGVELDDLGNSLAVSSATLTPEVLAAEVERLYAKGVRYVFPVHVTDNQFGGTAVYENLFNVANRRQTGRYWDLECSAPGAGINYRFEPTDDAALQLLSWLRLGTSIGEQPPTPPVCAPGTGHVNRKGLTTVGRALVTELMRRGLLIDVDHMSERAVNETLSLAESMPGVYPMASGHNGLRGAGAHAEATSEQARTREQLVRIASGGGMLGVGWGSAGDASVFLEDLRAAVQVIGANRVGLGTDANGLVVAPGPRAGSSVSYDTAFPRSQSGARTWDYNHDGLAHYGLIPDLLRDVRSMGGGAEVDALYTSAEAFARMWEKAEAVAPNVPPSVPPQPTPETRMVTPSTWGPVCPKLLLRGDREFGGNGPRVDAQVRLSIAADGSGVDATLDFHAVETRSNWSETRGTWRRRVFTAAAGERVVEVLSATQSRTEAVSAAAGFQVVFPGGTQIVASPPVYDGDLVREFLIVGDTGGNDISTDDNCSDDTRISVVFNPVTVRVTR